VTEKPQSPATPPVVPDCPPKLGHGPTHLHRPTSNPTQVKCDQHDSAITVHGATTHDVGLRTEANQHKKKPNSTQQQGCGPCKKDAR
jgi:hypothetical protein